MILLFNLFRMIITKSNPAAKYVDYSCPSILDLNWDLTEFGLSNSLLVYREIVLTTPDYTFPLFWHTFTTIEQYKVYRITVVAWFCCQSVVLGVLCPMKGRNTCV